MDWQDESSSPNQRLQPNVVHKAPLFKRGVAERRLQAHTVEFGEVLPTVICPLPGHE